MKIAFIGLGNMGGGMAINLVRAGHTVMAFDLSEGALARARDQGCETAETISEAVCDADAVITMLPNGAIVKQVYATTIIGDAPNGALLIDCSTIDLDVTRELAVLAQQSGYQMVDAPVSGGIGAANSGTLTFMVGGSDQGFARAQDVLGAMGKAVIHAGPSGSGQIAKACNNLLLAVHMIGTCEAMVMAQKAGLAPEKFHEISSKSTGYNWSLNDYTPMPGVGAASPADNGYHGGFASTLMLKDLGLAMNIAELTKARIPMGEAAGEIYKEFVADGNGALDFSAILTTF